MRITPMDIRGNRNVYPAGVVPDNAELRRRIAAAWKVFTESPHDAVSEAAYLTWGALVDELTELERQQ